MYNIALGSGYPTKQTHEKDPGFLQCNAQFEPLAVKTIYSRKEGDYERKRQCDPGR